MGGDADIPVGRNAALDRIVDIIDAAKPTQAPISSAGPAATKRHKKRSAKAVGSSPPLVAPEINLRLAFFPQTDLGNAERFRERYRGKILWAAGIGPFWWDGKRYNREGADEEVRIAVHQTARSIQDEAEALSDCERNVQVGVRHKGKPDEETIMMSDALSAWGRTSEQSPHLSAISREAPPYLAVARELLDSDPFKFNCDNGTLVFGKQFPGYADFRTHSADDLITKISPVRYDPSAQCPLFDQFLAYVQPDPAIRRLLMQWLGYSLTGDTSEQKICISWGEGSNGKSTLMEICAYIAGDYSRSIPVETFLDDGRGRSPGQASPDLAMLPGVRFLRTSEPPRGAKLAEAQIKLATGGEPITARHLNKEFFEFRPEFKLSMSGNHKPKILGGDYGIWRRVIFVPWRVQISKESKDERLKEKLIEEASGILNRLIDGLRDWLDHGLILPPGVTEATDDYRSDSDPAGEFLKECVRAAPGERVRANKMHALFKAWSRANAAEEWSPKGLSRALQDKGLTSRRSNGMWWLDVQLTKDEGDFIDVEQRPRDGATDATPAKETIDGEVNF